MGLVKVKNYGAGQKYKGSKGRNNESIKIKNKFGFGFNTKCKFGMRMFFLIMVGLTCFYQMYLFLGLYFEYPTNVYLTIERKNSPNVPGVSCCDGTTITNSSVKAMQLKNITITSGEEPEVLEKRHEFVSPLNKLLWACTFIEKNDRSKYLIKEVLRYSVWLYLGSKRSCWNLNPLWKNVSYKSNDGEGYVALSLRLFWNTTEATKIKSESPPAGFIYLHNLDEIPNKMSYHFRVMAGIHFSIRFTRTTVDMLKPPYQTMCHNYTENPNEGIWTNVISQETCFFDCFWDKMLSECNCIPEGESALKGMKICHKTMKCLNNSWRYDLKEYCTSRCPNPCLMEFYDFLITSSKATKVYETTLWIDVRSSRNVAYTHVKRFSPVEVFSNVGGYMGIWLGFSFPLFYSFFEKCVIATLTNRFKSRSVLPSREEAFQKIINIKI